MLQEIIILFATSTAVGFGGWIFGRRKKKAEAKAAEIGNLDLIASMWQRTAETFKKAHDELVQQNSTIMLELNALRFENKNLENHVVKLNKMVEDLKCENKGLLRRINEIKKYQQDQIKN